MFDPTTYLGGLPGCSYPSAASLGSLTITCQIKQFRAGAEFPAFRIVYEAPSKVTNGTADAVDTDKVKLDVRITYAEGTNGGNKGFFHGLLASTAGTRLRLNRSERLDPALEGVAGAIAQVHVLRFGEPHAEAEIRAATRDLVRICPRLRTLVEPTLLGYRLRVLAEGARIDALCHQAFAVEPGGGDPRSLQGLVDRLVNEPFDLERALPLRARLLTGGPLPILVLKSAPPGLRRTGDDRLLDALMARLNGLEAAPMPLDDPSMIPAIAPAGVRSLWRLFRLHLEERSLRKGTRALNLTKERGADFGPRGVRLHAVAADSAAVKAAATARGCSVTELLVAVLASSFARETGWDPRAPASVRLSLDLRPYFPPGRRPEIGNYVASFLVRLTEWADIDASTDQARAQMRGLGRFERREMGYPLLLAELAPWLLGRRLLGWCVRQLKRRGRLQPVTVHFSNLGNVDALNRHGTRAQLAEHASSPPRSAPTWAASALADGSIWASPIPAPRSRRLSSTARCTASTARSKTSPGGDARARRRSTSAC